MLVRRCGRLSSHCRQLSDKLRTGQSIEDVDIARLPVQHPERRANHLPEDHAGRDLVGVAPVPKWDIGHNTEPVIPPHITRGPWMADVIHPMRIPDRTPP
jgi:hypothetical protein